MRKLTALAILTMILGSTAQAQGPKKGAPPRATKPATKGERMSYAIGADIGRNLKNNLIAINLSQFFNGIRDGLSTKPLAMSDDELRVGIRDFQAAMLEAPLKRGKQFLADNAKKPGIKTTASGLQYKVIRAGKGGTPKLTDEVTTHYEGRFLNGKVFDSSIKRGRPASFPVMGVIKGWTEALQLMKVGDKWQLYIPSELAYGRAGSPGGIGPNETLIFDIELLKIKGQ